ncbi:ABC transporter permease [Pararobbsia silviterrae]|uniref:ABC transporter permease n=1 Tax=Pararobbsia silviterrae TaxID=1792498 RepID=A0A494XZW3_9BURK|nr:ABC transporter permease [Pararobbsia silviterrae]RKP53736.1 ABC transporter permease [Pararobbsia silviterrae]
MNAKTIRDPQTEPRQTAGKAKRGWRKVLSHYQLEVRMGLLFVLICAALGISSPHFLSLGNVLNLMDQAVVTGIAAIGQTFVVLVGGIDLSVGSLTGVGGIVLGLAINTFGIPLIPSIAIAIIGGGLLGLVNGLLVTRGRIAPFIVTLGMMSIGRSLAFVLTNGNSISTLPDALSAPSTATVFGFPVNFLLVLVLFAVTWAYLTFAKGGRTIYALGSNREAARAAGLRVDFYNVLVYVLSGAFSALAAVMLASRLMSIDPIAGTGLELDSIAAVVIGGASLFGGRGSMIGTFFGVLILVLIHNGLNLLNVGPYWQGSAIGTVIIVAVLGERLLSARFGARAK